MVKCGVKKPGGEMWVEEIRWVNCRVKRPSGQLWVKFGLTLQEYVSSVNPWACS